MTDWSCSCGYDPDKVRPRYGVEWQRSHAIAHVTAFPDLDDVSRRNLWWFVELADGMERDKEKGCPVCGRRFSHSAADGLGSDCTWMAPTP